MSSDAGVITMALRRASAKLADAASVTEVASRLAGAGCRQPHVQEPSMICPLALWYRKQLEAEGVLENDMTVRVFFRRVMVQELGTVIATLWMSEVEQAFRESYDTEPQKYPELRP